MVFVWLGALILFCILEAVTAALVSIWFAAGALAALIVTLCGGALWLQLLVFFTVSVVVLVAVRPAARKLMARGRTATNADALVGCSAYVTGQINNLKATGTVQVGGQTWTARARDENEVIPVGAEVKIDRIEGVKLIVHLPEEQPVETVR